MSDTDILDNQQISEYLKELSDWRVSTGTINAVFETRTAAEAIKLFGLIASAAEIDNHHPDVDWRYNRLFVSTTSHDVGSALTTRDIALATKISEHAQNLGAIAHPELISAMEIVIDTDSAEAISAQWAAGLGYTEQDDGSLADPHRRMPAIWFQKTQSPNPSRLHLDLWKPYSESHTVLDKLDASGATADHKYAPSCVVITDAQGNRFCLCTEKDR